MKQVLVSTCKCAQSAHKCVVGITRKYYTRGHLCVTLTSLDVMSAYTSLDDAYTLHTCKLRHTVVTYDTSRYRPNGPLWGPYDSYTTTFGEACESTSVAGSRRLLNLCQRQAPLIAFFICVSGELLPTPPSLLCSRSFLSPFLQLGSLKRMVR